MSSSNSSGRPDLSAGASGGPRLGRVLAGHLLFTLLYTILFATVTWLMPMLVRLQFGSDDPATKDWQTTLITASLPTFMVLSIFWNELLQRTTLRTYLLIFWFVAVVPLGCVGFVQNYSQLLACHIVATAGLAGWPPVHGRLLKHLYSDQVRGRAYAAVNVVALGGGAAAAYAVGKWLAVDPEAFRTYFPATALLQLAGVAILLRLAHVTRTPDEPVATPWSWGTLLRPVLHMGQILRADRTFLRYERAFMTYGAAYMLCDALLPVLATTRLGMEYEDYAMSTQMVLRLSTLVVTLPMGWLLDRFGPIRTSGLAFGVLGIYPLLLWTAGGTTDIGVASAIYGIGMGGVSMGWMLGPVMLAGSSERVPQYVAIHTTLVGIRGIVFQGLGMLLYQLTHSFAWPLALAGLAFLWAAFQMWRLHGTLQRSATPSPAVIAAADDEPHP